jgi:hypothetical protein
MLEKIKNLLEILAILAAGYWFIKQSLYTRRVQFEIDCKFVQHQENPNDVFAELQFIFDNKGFVKHRMWNLNVSVHQLENPTVLAKKSGSQEVIFGKAILPKIQLVPPRYEYYFVRPGVRQIITHIITVPKSASVIRVTASFNYGKIMPKIHTTRRIFLVS